MCCVQCAFSMFACVCVCVLMCRFVFVTKDNVPIGSLCTLVLADMRSANEQAPRDWRHCPVASLGGWGMDTGVPRRGARGLHTGAKRCPGRLCRVAPVLCSFSLLTCVVCACLICCVIVVAVLRVCGITFTRGLPHVHQLPCGRSDLCCLRRGRAIQHAAGACMQQNRHGHVVCHGSCCSSKLDHCASVLCSFSLLTCVACVCSLCCAIVVVVVVGCVRQNVFWAHMNECF